jgi:hypothetical protein
MAPDASTARESLRSAYEHGRARRALVSALPVFPLGLLAWLIVRDGLVVAAATLALFVSTALFFWRGRDFARGVLPGALAGVVPFLAMVTLRGSMGAMSGASCVAHCVPASALSGLVAGVAIGTFAARAGSPARAWLSAGITATLVGALACACMGVSGLVGLALGLLAGSAPLAIRAQLGRA